LVFGAQLCSARAASEDVIKDAHTKDGSDQATVRMMRSLLLVWWNVPSGPALSYVSLMGFLEWGAASG
jgi:hypothetical protein